MKIRKVYYSYTYQKTSIKFIQDERNINLQNWNQKMILYSLKIVFWELFKVLSKLFFKIIFGTFQLQDTKSDVKVSLLYVLCVSHTRSPRALENRKKPFVLIENCIDINMYIVYILVLNMQIHFFTYFNTFTYFIHYLFHKYNFIRFDKMED